MSARSQLATAWVQPPPSAARVAPDADAHDPRALRFLTAGSVDDGKSTLIGPLLYESKLLYEDQLAALEADSRVNFMGFREPKRTATRLDSRSAKVVYGALKDAAPLPLVDERSDGKTAVESWRRHSVAPSAAQRQNRAPPLNGARLFDASHCQHVGS